MSNELVVKEVEFLNTNLLAIQQKETGRIYAAINFILRGLGFDDIRIRYQRDKWLEDKVISKGVQKFYHPSEIGGTQETYCISLNKLPLALAKINMC